MTEKCNRCRYEFKAEDSGAVCKNEHLICIKCLTELEGTKCPYCKNELYDIFYTAET